MFKQMDGVAMGSPLGPVLANIFIGYHESRLFPSILHKLPEWYKWYVHDTFAIFNGYGATNSFLDTLNNLHASLNFTHKYDKDKLLFLDVLMHKEDTGFMTSIYRKPTFMGLYTKFDSFSARKQNLSLIKCLIDHTYKIPFERFLQSNLEKLKSIFLCNGYPEKYNPIGPAKCPVYLKLPWIGQISETFWHLIKLITDKHFLMRTILPLTHKGSLLGSSSMWIELIKDWAIGSNNMVPSIIRNKTQP